MNNDVDIELFDPDSDGDSDITIKEYDIVSSPNDFNVLSYFNFIEAGSIVIPGFQRNYVWDVRKASKLIESVLMGLPIPQIFLYEEAKNRFLVIDGQQRLMTIYYFMCGRFPKRDARAKIRAIFNEKGRLEKSDLEDDALFSTFKLSFNPDGAASPYQGLTYASLGDLKSTFDLRTIRNIMVKQVRPDDDKSSIFELFNRLNTGGINLSPQEIRMSLFYGDFMRLAIQLNENENWRKILGSGPDQRQKDVEIILRIFALSENYENFKKPLSKFINEYCRKMKNHSDENGLYTQCFTAFSECLADIDRNLFLEPKSKRVSVPIIEACFAWSTANALNEKDATLIRRFDDQYIIDLRKHPRFEDLFTGKTTDVDSVKGRMLLAVE
ncbi:DUF262 domain-containing protein [Parahaliea mediterranea]|uniref:DUF262 domain-containing protein n=1 Tax=Parahaliea mediterranea TaxID=651086 RepID=A0A939DJ65_9GAMM|nr:DUF262 domain-containing protein [Parahaliea mediterranea]MBN7798432.1 DUF262 domain-containing protein [Parahaliea mediterranea]